MNENKQQTAMNELLLWVRKTLPMDLDYPRMIEDKIESLIPKEKEQIMDDFMAGKWDWAEHIKGKESKDPVEYYNETYKNK